MSDIASQQAGVPSSFIINQAQQYLKSFFPFSAFSFDDPNITNPPTLSMKSPWKFTAANMLLGGIVASGSNSNGSYIQFADGTMICIGASYPFVTVNPVNNIYQTGSMSIAYPAAFQSLLASPQMVVYQDSIHNTGTVWPGESYSVGLSSCVAYVIGATSVSNGLVSIIIWGRWK